ncbi:MAG: hypothetical protein ACTHYV_03120 [Psychroflexus sp.]
MKKIFILFLVLIVASCQDSSQSTSSDSYHLLPLKSILVFDIQSLEDLNENLNQNEFLASNMESKLIVDLKDKFDLLQSVDPKLSGLLSISAIGTKDFAFTFIVNTTSEFFKAGVIEQKSSETYDGIAIQKVQIDQKDFYLSELSGHQVISTSKLTLENIIRNSKNNLDLGSAFFKAKKASRSRDLSIYVSLDHVDLLGKSHFQSLDFDYENYGKWMVLDTDLETQKIWSSGVVISQENKHSKFETLEGNTTENSNFAEIVPLNASYFVNFSVKSFKNLQQKRRQLGYTDDIIKHRIGEYPAEFGIIKIDNYYLIDFKPDDVLGFEEEFLQTETQVEEFRGENIYQLDNFDGFQHFSPLLPKLKTNHVVNHQGHFVFAEKLDQLESLLVNLKNNSILSKTSYYKETADDLRSSYSVQIGFLNENLKSHLSGKSTDAYQKSWKTLKTESFKFGLAQLTNDKGFTHVNFSFGSTENGSSSNLKVNRIKFEKDLITSPSYFINWRTRQRDIAVQDEDYQLHLVSSKGQKIWTKQLDSKIVGDIQWLDIYKNTRIQMAFVTQNKLYILDKNGKDVGHFPLSFNDIITQGLQIYDYANNGKYRFVVTQNNNMMMYDKEGKNVKGFKYHASDDKIINPPKHIRISNKDYILVQTESDVYILNRVGDIRVKKDRLIESSQNEFFRYDDQFAGTNTEGQLVTVSEEGKVNFNDEDWYDGHHFAANNRNYVVLSENTLHINDKKLKLDYGLYLTPQLHQFNEQLFISVVDEQSQKIYLFNEDAELINAFPVFGSSEIQILEIEPGRYEILTKGDNNSVLVYQLSL